ncbi:MAG: outer membrane protein assembly factor BamD [Gemmatimonadetes bacterium]|nr:outer membrane protein assembly factor BamD [Gemmatimonadota bacterium]
MRFRHWGAIALTLAAAAGCASGGPPLARLSGPDALFERGIQEYQAKHWTDAIAAFERLALEYPTYTRVQEARFRLADSYFGKKEYLTAATEFVRLATDYPSGAWADDARFKTCESYYRLSPKVQLDQQYTRAAIEHCESLLAYYPNSEFAPRARALVQDLTDKLAEKIFVGAEFYYRNRAFDSAILYYEEVLSQYPRSTLAPRALLRLVQVYDRIGYEEEAEAAKERLLREYPESAEAKQAQGISLASSP